MPSNRRLPKCGLAVAAAFAIAACSESTAPQAHPSDPQGLSSDLQAAFEVFGSSTFQSFSVLTFVNGSPVAPPKPAGSLLRAAPIVPPRALAAPYLDRGPQLQALRRMAANFRNGITASVVPPALLGKTFTWDLTTHAYVEDGTYTPAAPSDRVRIILYAVSPTNGEIIESPLTPVGYTDLVDESTTSPAVDKLHIVVTGGSPTSPGTVYIDYTVSAQVTGNPITAFTAAATGSVTDGTNSITFNATYGVTQVNTDNPDVAVDVTWALSNPALQLTLHETLTLSDADHLTLSVGEFSVARGTETVTLKGTVSTVLSTGVFDLTLSVDVNRSRWANVTGNEAGVALRHPDGTRLSDPEAQAFLDLFTLWLESDYAMTILFGPPGTLMGA